MASKPVSSAFNVRAIVLTHGRGTKDTSELMVSGAYMADYQDILRFLASNPPHLEPERRMHASLLEMLARKLRGEEIKFEAEVLKSSLSLPHHKKRIH